MASWDKMLVQAVETNEPGRMLQSGPAQKKQHAWAFRLTPGSATSDDNFIQKATLKLAEQRGLLKNCSQQGTINLGRGI